MEITLSEKEVKKLLAASREEEPFAVSLSFSEADCRPGVCHLPVEQQGPLLKDREPANQEVVKISGDLAFDEKTLQALLMLMAKDSFNYTADTGALECMSGECRFTIYSRWKQREYPTGAAQELVAGALRESLKSL